MKAVFLIEIESEDATREQLRDICDYLGESFKDNETTQQIVEQWVSDNPSFDGEIRVVTRTQ